MDSTENKVHGHGHFIPGSVRVVDYNSHYNNILVRGSSAFGAKKEDGSSFAIADLLNAIQSDANFAGTPISLASNPRVIDFCLIGFGSDKDKKIVESEIAWFDESGKVPDGNSGPYPVYFTNTRRRGYTCCTGVL